MKEIIDSWEVALLKKKGFTNIHTISHKSSTHGNYDDDDTWVTAVAIKGERYYRVEAHYWDYYRPRKCDSGKEITSISEITHDEYENATKATQEA